MRPLASTSCSSRSTRVAPRPPCKTPQSRSQPLILNAAVNVSNICSSPSFTFIVFLLLHRDGAWFADHLCRPDEARLERPLEL